MQFTTFTRNEHIHQQHVDFDGTESIDVKNGEASASFEFEGLCVSVTVVRFVGGHNLAVDFGGRTEFNHTESVAIAAMVKYATFRAASLAHDLKHLTDLTEPALNAIPGYREDRYAEYGDKGWQMR